MTQNNTCPACKSTNTKDASIRENNGIYGPGAASWVVEEKSICNDCGVYFKPMGNEPTIDVMNRTIAIFMKLIPVPCGTKRLGDIKHPEVSEAFLNYHERWELLMPVYHKTRERAFEMKENKNAQRLLANINQQLLFGIIADVHYHVYQFITWLNQQKQKDEVSTKSI